MRLPSTTPIPLDEFVVNLKNMVQCLMSLGPWEQVCSQHATPSLWGNLGKGVPRARLQVKWPELNRWWICQHVLIAGPRMWDWHAWPVGSGEEGWSGLFILSDGLHLSPKGNEFLFSHLWSLIAKKVSAAAAAPLLARCSRSKTRAQSSPRWRALGTDNKVC